jgi:hypothetical protein
MQEAAWNRAPVMKPTVKGLNFHKNIKTVTEIKCKLRINDNSQEIHTIKICGINLVNNYPRKSKVSSNHRLTCSSQSELQIVALSIVYGKLQNI